MYVLVWLAWNFVKGIVALYKQASVTKNRNVEVSKRHNGVFKLYLST